MTATAESPPAAPSHPKFCRTLDAIAKLVRDEFGFNCDKQKIKNWQTRRTPSFPPRKGDQNEFDVAECFEWVRKNVTAADKKPSNPKLEKLLDKAEMSHAESKITSAKREQFKLEKEMDLYIYKDVAFQKTVGALMKLKQFVREEIERRIPMERREKLRALGVSEEIAAQFFAWDLRRQIELIDAVELRCEKEAEEDETIAI